MIPPQVGNRSLARHSAGGLNSTLPPSSPAAPTSFLEEMDLVLLDKPPALEAGLLERGFPCQQDRPPSIPPEGCATLESDPRSRDREQPPPDEDRSDKEKYSSETALPLSSACALILQPALPLSPEQKIPASSSPGLTGEGTSTPGQIVPTGKETIPGSGSADTESDCAEARSKREAEPGIPSESNSKSKTYVNSALSSSPPHGNKKEAVPSLLLPHGITDAPRQENMQREAIMDQASPGDEKSLPPISPVDQTAPQGQDLPSRTIPASALLGATETVSPATNAATNPETPAPSGGTESIDQVETISEMILRQAVELRRVRADAMEVVLRPDQETELHIQVTQEKGIISVCARCEKGDWEALSAHWSDLQRSLGTQGVLVSRLESPLPSPSSATSPFGALDQNHQHAPRDRDQRHPAFRDPPSSSQTASGSRKPLERASSPVPPGRSKRWESWA